MQEGFLSYMLKINQPEKLYLLGFCCSLYLRLCNCCQPSYLGICVSLRRSLESDVQYKAFNPPPAFPYSSPVHRAPSALCDRGISSVLVLQLIVSDSSRAFEIRDDKTVSEILNAVTPGSSLKSLVQSMLEKF